MNLFADQNKDIGAASQTLLTGVKLHLCCRLLVRVVKEVLVSNANVFTAKNVCACCKLNKIIQILQEE